MEAANKKSRRTWKDGIQQSSEFRWGHGRHEKPAGLAEGCGLGALAGAGADAQAPEGSLQGRVLDTGLKGIQAVSALSKATYKHFLI